jgi:hypothetical protein
MISDDVQQKFQRGHKGGLEEILQDDILQLGGSLGEARIEYLKEFVTDLSRAVTNYIFSGLVRAPRVSVEETGEINMYFDGVSTSKIPILRPVSGDSFRGVVEVTYDFGGKASIRDNKLKLELARRRILEERRDYGIIVMMETRYESQKIGLYYLRRLARKDKMLPLAIWLLDEKLDVKDIGEKKGIVIEYDMLTGKLKTELCGVDIMEVLKGRRNTYINMLHSLIYSYQGPAGRKCIEMESKVEQDVILLNTNYIIKKEVIEHKKHIIEKYIIDSDTDIFKKEKIPEDLNTILSEKTLHQKYTL